MKYFFPCLLFLANSEVISTFALLIIFLIFCADVMKERLSKYE